MDESFSVSTKRISGIKLPARDEEIKLLRWSVHDFFINDVLPHVYSKRVLEIGPAKKVQGKSPEYWENTKKRLVAQYNEYTSIDIEEKSGADIIDDIINLFNHVEKRSFDVIIGMEVLEHVRELHKIPGIFYDALTHKGMFYISSPFYFIHHDPKPDYWRISQDGYKALFGDLFKLEIQKVIVEDSGDRPLHMRVKGYKR
jgi:hypothetical protein